MLDRRKFPLWAFALPTQSNSVDKIPETTSKPTRPTGYVTVCRGPASLGAPVAVL